jgi:hypothetical protein
MPQKNYGPAVTPIDPVSTDSGCPKCKVPMEPIEIGVEGLPLQHLQLCPRCYLVTWSDQDGLHARQGVPMKKGFHPESDSERRPPVGKPEEC